MVDSFSRWCLFCDLEVHGNAPQAPIPMLNDYVDDLLHSVARREAFRVFENGSRVNRIADARRAALPDGTDVVEMLVTLGDRRGADPSFIHFETGTARDPEKLEGEVKGRSAHVVLKLDEDPQSRGRYRILVEEVRSIGRTPLTRLLNSVFKELAETRGDRYRNAETNRFNAFRPVTEIYPRRSREMARALDRGTFLPVELIDTSRTTAFDENPEFQVRSHRLSVKVEPGPGRTLREALQDLATMARGEGFDRMRVNWRMPGEMRGGTSEMATDLADVGTALFAHRELVQVENAMTECAVELNDEFLEAMRACFM